MGRRKEREARIELAKIAAKAERLGFEIPEEVRRELHMEKVKGVGIERAGPGVEPALAESGTG